jgi:hypothetical protein
MLIRKAINEAVEARYNEILSTFEQREGDYIYTGHRCSPEYIARRFRQVVSGIDTMVVFNPAAIRAGDYDKGIEDTWHDAAGAEHWYMYEKEWV